MFKLTRLQKCVNVRQEELAIYYIEVDHRNERTLRHCFEVPDTTSIRFEPSNQRQ